jgi:hypothetical protein
LGALLRGGMKIAFELRDVKPIPAGASVMNPSPKVSVESIPHDLAIAENLDDEL